MRDVPDSRGRAHTLGDELDGLFVPAPPAARAAGSAPVSTVNVNGRLSLRVTDERGQEGQGQIRVSNARLSDRVSGPLPKSEPLLPSWSSVPALVVIEVHVSYAIGPGHGALTGQTLSTETPTCWANSRR